MIHPLWRVCLLKRGTAVQVNVNYANAYGIPEQWASGVLAGVAQHGRLARVWFHSTGNHKFSGTTTTVAAFRVKPAFTRTAQEV
jgi:hypothetical protein